ncbi:MULTISPECIES: hypothetical protein [Acinetobacter]|uniref:Uncharacterized protein n=1 Tax=Acinetobacter bereziniae NIPH 3 TaxID=1217651 RepID=N8X5W3_ACIBZ|nr:MULTISPECIES: hypothetical protein [Acinetobacter]ATZ65465.1 hypothetical protein BSR55_20120 [Acinetobacter bereziniae]ENV19752.1 hypothetical protein F963_04391 [Acinetobacter bereziniae NIPH 3]MBJ9902878.1 hypothetical protein [Acinetobacter bereziniae]MCU4318430.1 hypothetical protein [Acinetobacter bereziniae]MCU4597963.1 hypothetical protein [Acinetobacter bereziniae]
MNIHTSILIITCSLLTLGCASKSEREFISGCQSTGMDRSACKCAYKKLESKYGEDSLKNNLYTLTQTESFQYDLMQSGLQCLRE